MFKKSKTIIALCLISLCCLSCGFVGFADSATDTAASLSTFEMVAGAEVRTAEPNGIRFTTQISSSEYDALQAKVEEGVYKSVEFGSIICPSYYVTEENGGLTLENEYVQTAKRTTWDSEYNPDKATDVYQYNCDLINIKDDNLAREFQAIGYCTIVDAQDNTATYYATVKNEGDNARTPLYVATYNIVKNGSDSDFLLETVDKAMVGNELTLSDTAAKTVDIGDEIDLPKGFVAGKEVVLSYSSEEPGIAKVENGKIKGVAYGKTNIIASLIGKTQTYQKKIPVTVNDPNFNDQPVRTSGDATGKTQRSISSSIFYEKGVGVYAQAEINHNVKQLGAQWNTLQFEITFEGNGNKQACMDLTTIDLVYSKMITKGTFFVVENPEGSATKYTSYASAFVPQSVLNEKGVDMSKGWNSVWVAAKVPGDSMIVEGFEHTSQMWWCSGLTLFGEQGWFVTEGETMKMEFDGDTEKDFGYSAVLNNYGLWIEAYAKADGTNASTFQVYFRPETNENGVALQNYKTSGGNTTTWQVVIGRNNTVNSDAFKNFIYYRIFLSYEQLSKKAYYNSSTSQNDYLYGISESNPFTINSELYLTGAFQSDSDADKMDFYYRDADRTDGYKIVKEHTTNATLMSADRRGPKNNWYISRPYVGMPDSVKSGGTQDLVTTEGIQPFAYVTD